MIDTLCMLSSQRSISVSTSLFSYSSYIFISMFNFCHICFSIVGMSYYPLYQANVLSSSNDRQLGANASNSVKYRVLLCINITTKSCLYYYSISMERKKRIVEMARMFHLANSVMFEITTVLFLWCCCLVF